MKAASKELLIQKYDIRDYKKEDIIIPDMSGKNGLVLIVGTSGSGKSTILESIGSSHDIKFDNSKDIIDNFSTIGKAETLLLAMGLRSIPTWFKKSNQVSNGEKHRAECALYLDNGVNFIDEFTSVVDRDTAKSLSTTIRKYFSTLDIETLYVASCHRDIIEWLQPDHIYDTDMQKFIDKELPRRPPIKLEIIGSSYEDWVYFKKHHYLDSSMSKSVHSYTAYINGMKVAFLSVIHGCGRDIKSYWRECRLVVLPEFQGVGIGKALSDSVAQEYIDRGLRYFSKTSHPAMGLYRNTNPKWRATSTNEKKRRSYLKKDGTARLSKGYGKTEKSIMRDANRLTYSHEYMGGTYAK